MKVLWLCNIMPGVVRSAAGEKSGSGLWMDHVLAEMGRNPDIRLRVVCPGVHEDSGEVSEVLGYLTFHADVAYQYSPSLEQLFRKELAAFCPDLIHIWGTEYGHSLAMVNAAHAEGMADRLVISIQGLCSVYANHYAEGIPEKIIHRFTLRDFLRWDNISLQRDKFVRRGELEVQALQKANHVIGRTDWDEACTGAINPERVYHFCNETMREAFYEGRWHYNKCVKHRIFASSCAYPVKGFHYLLEALPLIVRQYPDVSVTVTGSSFFCGEKKSTLRMSGYEKYLADCAESSGLRDRIQFLGKLNAEQMKQAFLDANVFVLPSTIENSPNSLGEAMLLGVPCVAADVGGVSNMMRHDCEGYVYQSTAPYMLARYICRVFEMQDQAETIGQKAREHALVTHDPAVNQRTLLSIYASIAKGAGA